MKKATLACALAALGFARTAGAQTLTLGTDRGRDPYESRQNFAVELRFSPWQPNVDGEFGGGAHPFYDFFGESDGASDPRRVRDRLLGGLEFDWQALRFGSVASLGLGVGAAYSAFTANSPVTATGQASGQESALHLLPMHGVAVLRFDLLARRTVVPLVFYGKAGLAVTHWWVTSGEDFARRNDNSPPAPDHTADFGKSARGFSLGWQFGGGVMLRLDWLEPRAQRAWDLEMGVNHSYLFAEYMVVSDWSRPQLHIGSNTWVFGLAFEL